MSDFIALLEQFNRKERFFLVLQATGQKQLNLSRDFIEELCNELGSEDDLVPEDFKGAFVATDYHLDWLAASMAAYRSGLPEGEYVGKPFPNHGEQKTVSGSIEDIDLLIAFKEKDRDSYHVILVEAKGYTGWSNPQLNSKAERLKRILPNPDNDGIKPHFCLISPKEPPELTSQQIEEWPEWMRKGSKYYWASLSVPSSRLKVTRTDREGHSSRQGENFKICKDGLDADQPQS